MGRQFVHPLAAARGAEAAFFTGEGDKAFVLTRLTPEPSKPVGQNPATKVGFDFLINMRRKGPSVGIFLRGRKERLEILLDRPVKNGTFRLMPDRGDRSCYRT